MTQPLYPEERIDDHFEQARTRLTPPFRRGRKAAWGDKNRLECLMEALIEPVQDIEDMLWDLLGSRFLFVTFDAVAHGYPLGFLGASGAQLDLIGKAIGLERVNGQIDADYRARLQVWYLYLTSCGEPDRLIQIIDNYTSAATIEFDEYFPGHIIITIDSWPSSPSWILWLINASAAAGVGIVLVYAPAGVYGYGYGYGGYGAYGYGYGGDAAFRFDTPDHGFDDGLLGRLIL